MLVHLVYNSVTHWLCRFDPNWIKNPKYHDRNFVEADNTLSETDKYRLLGVLARQGEDMLPSQPSLMDRRYLIETYGM